MIPRVVLTAWRSKTPWPNDVQVEQDLILSRLMLEIAGDDVLGGALALRGGTCLHKLHLAAPLRYSEDLDYVCTAAAQAGLLFDRLRAVGARIGLRPGARRRSEMLVSMRFRFTADARDMPSQVKVEINMVEPESVLGHRSLPFAVDSPRWWSGAGSVRTFALEELLGTKLRALHQRKKGRDLFDLWLGLTSADADQGIVARCARHYLPRESAPASEIAASLERKVADSVFRGDLEGLTVEPPSGYDIDAAARLILEWIEAWL